MNRMLLLCAVALSLLTPACERFEEKREESGNQRIAPAPSANPLSILTIPYDGKRERLS